MAASTLSRVSARTFGWSLRTRDTVWWETPASRATSAMTGGRARLPGPLTTDAVSRLLASSPDDRVTSCLLAARGVASGQPAPTLALTSVRGQMGVRSVYTPTSDRHLSSAARIPAFQRSLRTAPAVPARARPADPAPAPAQPTRPAAQRPGPRLAAPASGLVAVRRAVPQVPERRLGLASSLAVSEVLQRLACLAPRVAVPQVPQGLPGLAPLLALAKVAERRFGLAADLALAQVTERGLGLAAGLAVPEVRHGILRRPGPFGALPAP